MTVIVSSSGAMSRLTTSVTVRDADRGFELVRRPQVEGVARHGRDVAVADVAEAAAVAEDEEGADRARWAVRPLGADAASGQEDLSLVGGAGVVEAVEDQVGPLERPRSRRGRQLHRGAVLKRSAMVAGPLSSAAVERGVVVAEAGHLEGVADRHRERRQSPVEEGGRERRRPG